MPSSQEAEKLSDDELFDILAHPIRRRIVVLLYEHVELSYTQLLEALGIGTGHLNFHLRKLKPLIL